MMNMPDEETFLFQANNFMIINSYLVKEIKLTFSLIEDDWDTNEKFWEIFNCKSEDIPETSNFDDKDFVINFSTSNLSLFR